MDRKNRILDTAIMEQRIRDLKKLEEGGHYKEFWKNCKDMATFFKYSQLSREDRERLWRDYDALCKKVKGKRQSSESGAEDARLGQIDLRRYATDSEYRTAYDREETKRWPNLYDLESGAYLDWYHRMRDDRKAEHELDKTYRRAEDERKEREEIRRKRQKEIKKLGIGNERSKGAGSSKRKRNEPFVAFIMFLILIGILLAIVLLQRHFHVK
ncbi:MAG: hypothetical protein QME83_05760 [Thermodesulfobacteriota bacterium]|nr:hypothetical protein [Thermodesulfobacteriota bacterium]